MGGWDDTSAHLGGFSWTSGISCGRAQRSTRVGGIPELSAVAAQPRVGGRVMQSLVAGTAGLGCWAPRQPESGGRTRALAHRAGPPGPSRSSRWRLAAHPRPGHELGALQERSGVLRQEAEEPERLRAVPLSLEGVCVCEHVRVGVRVWKSMKLGLNMPLGQMYSREFKISSFLLFCWLNCMESRALLYQNNLEDLLKICIHCILTPKFEYHQRLCFSEITTYYTHLVFYCTTFYCYLIV